MKAMKIIATLLAVLMLVSAFPLVIFGEEAEKEYTYKTGNGVSLMKPGDDVGKAGADLFQYKLGIAKDGTVVSTPEQKLALMDYRYGNDRYELYVDAFSGEVAILDKKSGETMFTNPYNIGATGLDYTTSTTGDMLMSQLVIDYTPITTNQAEKLYSYTWAANRNQITVKSINKGIRVEYAIGRVESRSLLPHWMSKERAEQFFATIRANAQAVFEENKPGKEFEGSTEETSITRFESYYSILSLSEMVDTEKENMLIKFPELEKFDLYVIDETALQAEATVRSLEKIIRTYNPEYSFEDLDETHAEAGYEAKTESNPLFRMALEYTVDDKGLTVRLPANGIRFNESLYRLNYIEILPFMGAGTNPNPGYTFFPDGSGTLFDFQKIASTVPNATQVSGKMYGEDYAYHQITGRYEEIIRYPVFGLTETETITKTVEENGVTTTKTEQKDRGFVAIVEEGDSLLEITSSHGGQVHKYNSIYLSASPRPTDSYNLADSISVGGGGEWTVVSARKYTGNYKIRYMMLTDEDTAAEKGITDFYDTTYMGMAKAYRDYLIDNGTLTALNAADVEADIPLYIETFGAIMTTERFLSIPFNVMTPLTSFDDIATMYDELKEKEITNINFIMNGYTKGGMTNATMPYNLKWDKSVEKDMDFEELLEKAKAEGFGLFPDFDFVFSANDKLFDGLSLKKHAVKTIDNRYTSKREYSATRHTHVSFFEMAISPAYFDHFYEKFAPKYKKYEPIGISVSTLGNYLNSDFDEDEPYNRDDGKQYTIEAFRYLREQFADAELMTAGGNAYSWKYVDHITDIALDSSRYSTSSASVPFLAIVLHGYVELSGSATNMEGNLEYAFLKSMESGAAMKFILSYRNTENLKEYETLSKYYSVRYDIWFNDVVSMYHELNGLLQNVQLSTIEDHKFLNNGVRVPDDDELASDAMQSAANKIAAEQAKAEAAAKAKQEAILNARLAILNGNKELKNNTIAVRYDALKVKIATELPPLILAAEAAQATYKAAQEAHAAAKAVLKVAEDTLKAAEEAYDAAPTDVLRAAVDAAKTAVKLAEDAVEKTVNKGLADEHTEGTRPTRDAAKAAAQEAAKAVSSKLSEIYDGATALLNENASLLKCYTDAKAAIELLKAEDDVYTPEIIADLEALVNDADFKAAYDALLAKDYAGAENTESVFALANAAKDAVKALKDAVLADEADDSAEEFATSGVAELIVDEAYVYIAPSQGNAGGNTETDTEIKVEEIDQSKYAVDPNTIVYEEYSNGTKFIMNFNNYRISVELNGVTYTVDAYGYVILSRGA